MRFLVAVVLLGFPLALVLAWALEIKPDGGIQRAETGEATPGETPALLGKRALVVAGLLVAVRVGLSAGWLLKPAAPEPVERAAVTESETSEASDRDDERQPESLPETEHESIAVLPFVNMSPDPENAYFADGISEELLNILAGIEGLKVASRTSSFSFKGSNTAVRHRAWSPVPRSHRPRGPRRGGHDPHGTASRPALVRSAWAPGPYHRGGHARLARHRWLLRQWLRPHRGRGPSRSPAFDLADPEPSPSTSSTSRRPMTGTPEARAGLLAALRHPLTPPTGPSFTAHRTILPAPVPMATSPPRPFGQRRHPRLPGLLSLTPSPVACIARTPALPCLSGLGRRLDLLSLDGR